MNGVVAGRVKRIRPHPFGELIWLADVDTGSEVRQVVWGGVPVLTAGDMVPVALPGARLPRTRIRRREFRGEVSDGMLCSAAELGWGTEADRVLILPRGFRPGDHLPGRSGQGTVTVRYTEGMSGNLGDAMNEYRKSAFSAGGNCAEIGSYRKSLRSVGNGACAEIGSYRKAFG